MSNQLVPHNVGGVPKESTFNPGNIILVHPNEYRLTYLAHAGVICQHEAADLVRRFNVRRLP